MLKLKNKKAQSLIEFTTLIVIVLAVFLTIGNYFKRGVQGRWKQATDEMGDQYDPRTAVTNIVHAINSNTNTMITTEGGPAGYWTHRTDTTNMTETKKGNTVIGAY